MPNNLNSNEDGLGVGAAFANAADIFVGNFTKARLLKHSLEYQKNAQLIDVIKEDLKDDNLSYDERAKRADLIPGLLGVKVGSKALPIPLSRLWGMDKFNERMIDDPNKPAQAATPNSTLTDPNVIEANSAPNSDLNLNPNITMQGTNAVPAGQIRQGELTPADLKLQRALKLKQADSTGDIDKQTKLLELQQKLYIKGGFNIIPNSGFLDDSGNYFMKAMNTGGETKNISFGKVKPAAIALQEEKNKSLGANTKGKLGQLIAARTVVNEYEADNTSHPLADYQAAKSFIDDFEASGVVKKDYAASLELGNKGLKPIQPSQSVDDKLAASRFKNDIQKEIDQHQANITASQKVISDLTPRKKAADAELANATAAMDRIIKDEDYTPDDSEYKAANTRKVRAQQQVNALSTQLNKAVSTHEQSNTLLNGAKIRLNNVGNGAATNLTDAQKAVIQKIRNRNPDATKNMTDLDIINSIKH